MKLAHIPGALFFDVYGISDRTTNLPHMLPPEEAFAAAVSALGIENKDGVVVYDELKESLVASRATRVEIETRRAELETNLSTNLFRWRQELEAIQQSTFLYISYNFKFKLAGWLGVEEIGLYNFKPSVRPVPLEDTDQNLSHTLQFGFGLHHVGLNNKDRSFVEEIFANNKIQVMAINESSRLCASITTKNVHHILPPSTSDNFCAMKRKMNANFL
ncbi:unnamed protein product [Lactuca saligna]|uniref:Rhodanese domain-containing protein n=1 Tax=Lactuca saligna TaxID=75948 RepID=A0AA36E5L0_LACSI|nr:unnamed protein product [Lactuca saligna]